LFFPNKKNRRGCGGKDAYDQKRTVSIDGFHYPDTPKNEQVE